MPPPVGSEEGKLAPALGVACCFLSISDVGVVCCC